MLEPTFKQIAEAYVYWRMIEDPVRCELGTVEEVARKIANHPTGEMYYFWDMYDWLKEKGLVPEGKEPE